MEAKITEPQHRENIRFWKRWEENKSVLEIGRETGFTSPLKMKVAYNLGLHKRSITPDTLKKVSFDKSEEDLYYTENYEHKDNRVLRFAINYSQEKAKELLEEKIAILETTKIAVVSIKTTTYKNPKTLDQISDLLHSRIEKGLIQQAVNYLLDNKGTKTILIDIFERSIDQVMCTNGIPGIHTVVLYKNPANTEGRHEIVVIDPSNFFFSSHLSNKDIQENIKHKFLDKISTRHDAIQIYTPVKENIGSNADQWRECIDISVKLAFALNKESKDFKIDLTSINKYDFVQLISNLDSVDKSIISSNIPCSSRIKQSSDINEVKKFKACTETINKKQKIAFSFDKKLSEKIGIVYNDLLKCDRYDKIIESLLSLNGDITKTVTEEMLQYDKELSGSIDMIDEA